MEPILMTPHDHDRLSYLAEQLTETTTIHDSEVKVLERELDRADVVEDAELPADVVTMNSELLLVDIDTQEALSLRVVFPRAADIERGWISVLAPVGLAVLGSREGDEITWRTPRRVRRFRIERVTYQPEANGDPI
jgi:regulator of nucleoside diphosphate kinase